MTTKTASRPKASVRLKTLARVILYVKDTRKAAAWYAGKLGLKSLVNEDGWAELATEGTTLCLHGGRTRKVGGDEPCISFHVADFDATYAALKKAGLKLTAPVSPCHDTRYSAFTDPDGNHLSIEGK